MKQFSTEKKKSKIKGFHPLKEKKNIKIENKTPCPFPLLYPALSSSSLSPSISFTILELRESFSDSGVGRLQFEIIEEGLLLGVNHFLGALEEIYPL